MSHIGRIVILGEADELHTELVREHLHDEPVIINMGRQLLGYEYRHGSPWPTVTYDDKELPLGPGSVKSVWYRRTNVERLRPDLQIDPPEEREYALSSMQGLGSGLLSLFHPDTFWVSNPQAVTAAERKPGHLIQARLAGFNVPETLFTSDPVLAEAFVREQGPCVIKTLATTMPEGGNQYVQPRSLEEIDFRGLEVCPQIFQRALKPVHEVRATVIGNNVFASLVGDNDEAGTNQLGVRDYRRSFRTGTFYAEPFTLPESVNASCIKLVRQLDTVCGMIDLAMDANGTWWFFEDNPNGQWAFVDDETVPRIARAVARLLELGRAPWATERA